MTVSSIVLKYSAQGAERTQRADDGVRKGIQRTAQIAKREKGPVERWLVANRAGLLFIGTALTGILAGVISASPLLSAHLGGIRLAFSLLADSIADELTPAFVFLEDAIYKVVDAYEELPQPLQNAIAWTIGLAGVLGSIILIVGAVGPAFVAGLAIVAPILSAIAFYAAIAVGTVIGFMEGLVALGGAATVAGFTLAGLVGAIIGFAAVWVLEITGVLDKLAEFSEWVGTKLPGDAATWEKYITAFTVPLQAVGAAIVALVRGEGWSGIKSRLEEIVAQTNEAWGEIGAFFSNLLQNAFDWGSDMIHNFADGIRAGIGAVGDAAKSAWDTVTGWIGFDLPENDAMAQRFGSDLADHFGRGLRGGFEDLNGFGNGLIQAPGAPTTAPVAASSGGGGVTQVFNFERGAIVTEGTGNPAQDEDRLVERIVQRFGEKMGARSTR